MWKERFSMQTFKNVKFWMGASNTWKWWSSNGVVIYQYFQPSDGLPDPSGPLSSSVSPAAIKDANELWEVWHEASQEENMLSSNPSSRQRLASMPHCIPINQVAIRHFSKKVRVEMKVTSYWGRGNAQAHTELGLTKFTRFETVTSSY